MYWDYEIDLAIPIMIPLCYTQGFDYVLIVDLSLNFKHQDYKHSITCYKQALIAFHKMYFDFNSYVNWIYDFNA